MAKVSIKKRIFIIQNTAIAEPLPLSVYLTGLLSHYKNNNIFEFNLISAKSTTIPKTILSYFNTIHELSGSTYSIIDNLKFSISVYKILKKENTRSNISLLHCLYPNSSLLGAVLFKLFVKNKVEILYDVRSPWIEMAIFRGHVKKASSYAVRMIMNIEEKLLCRFVNKFMFISDGLRDYYQKKYQLGTKGRIFTVSPTGVDLKMFERIKGDIRLKYKVRKQEILIGYVGSAEKIRNLSIIIQYLKYMVDDGDEKTKLMFVGKGRDTDTLKTLVKKLKLRKRVIFVDTVPHSEIPKYIKSFDFGLCHLPDIFVYRSSFAIKILEYLACGVPVLASKMPANEEISKKLKYVYLYDQSSSSFCETLKRGVGEVKGRSISQDLSPYSWENIVKSYYEIYSC